MPKITVDEKELEVPAGQTIIKACDEAGIEIPRYCYHPGLPVAGNCRICMVQVEKMPKLTIACNTQAAEGLVIHTQSQEVKDARKAVLEFLLINHPIDCPVCDQAGECELQNYYMKHGQYDSRFVEDKIKKQKAVKVGPNVMLDSERCILCTRCVRFCDEITKTHELGIVNRGSREELVLSEGKTLDNNYSGNTVDICPVGALTDRDFRFQTRVWYLSSTPSVCPGCSMGCNIDIHSNRSRLYKAGGKRVARLKPRFNQAVNEWWMCDMGRYGYSAIDAPNRIQKPLKQENRQTKELHFDTAIKEVAQQLGNDQKNTGILVSASLTTEELFLVRQIANQSSGNIKILSYALNPDEKADDLLLKKDRNPNSAGLALLGLNKIQTPQALIEELKKGAFKTLYVLGHDLEKLCGPSALSALDSIETLIFQGTHSNTTTERAHWVLPSAVYAEKEGTFINEQGRIQIIRQAIAPIGEALADWEIFLKLGSLLGSNLRDLRTSEEVFAHLSAQVDSLKGLTYDQIGPEGKCLQTQECTKS
jgi:NADH-quinone oxidoreductase subunit G